MAIPRICSISDCGKPAINSRGWCRAHYQRWWKHGDPTAGSTSRGMIEPYFRNVVLVYDGDECLIWPFAKDGGYGRIWIDGKVQVVSRVVCEAVHGVAPTPHHDAAHSCGNGALGCVTKGHLSWKTRKENMNDAIGHGTTLHGQRNARAKLTEPEVAEIRRMKGDFFQREIADRFGVSRTLVSLIHSGKLWPRELDSNTR
jgi:hypothetical protein